MKFGIIRPAIREAALIVCKDLRAAQALVGLEDVDHGVVATGVSVVVYEFGLFTPPEQTSYFAIGGQLMSGNAVLYGYDETGETVDLEKLPPIIWLKDRDAAESAIALGLCARPQMAVNGDVIWQWPNPPPKGAMP